MRNTNTPGKERRIATAQQIGELLRQRRKARKKTQRELAATLGLSQARFSTLETDPSGLTLARLITLTNLLDLEIVVRDRAAKLPVRDW